MSRRVERVRVASAKLAEFSAREVAAILRETVDRRDHASLCLAGGSTPRATYLVLAELPDVPWSKVSVYFGDERCVPPDHADSNFRMAEEALLSRVTPKEVHRMHGELTDYDAAAKSYESVLPAAFDLLLLGLGEDAHTASLFPGDAAAAELTRRVMHVVGPKPPPNRLTITPVLLQSAQNVLVLAAGAGKAEAVARALEAPLDTRAVPSQWVRDAVWLMDHQAAGQLSGVLDPA